MGRAIAIRYEIGFSACTSAQQLGGGMLPPALPPLPPPRSEIIGWFTGPTTNTYAINVRACFLLVKQRTCDLVNVWGLA